MNVVFRYNPIARYTCKGVRQKLPKVGSHDDNARRVSKEDCSDWVSIF